MGAQGYVVKGTKGPRDVYAYGPGMGFGDACEEIDAHAFERLDAAAGARDHMVRLGCEATIYRVHDDGRETPLPSYEEALAALSQTQDLLSKAGDDVLRMSAEIERMRGAAKDMAFALAPWKYEGSIEGPGANDVVMKHRALCWVLFGEGAPPITEEERDAWQARRTERQKARTA
jgi:hypothetical protein